MKPHMPHARNLRADINTYSRSREVTLLGKGCEGTEKYRRGRLNVAGRLVLD